MLRYSRTKFGELGRYLSFKTLTRAMMVIIINILQEFFLQFVYIIKCRFTQQVFFGCTPETFNLTLGLWPIRFAVWVILTFSLPNVRAKSRTISRASSKDNIISAHISSYNVLQV